MTEEELKKKHSIYREVCLYIEEKMPPQTKAYMGHDEVFVFCGIRQWQFAYIELEKKSIKELLYIDDDFSDNGFKLVEREDGRQLLYVSNIYDCLYIEDVEVSRFSPRVFDELVRLNAAKPYSVYIRNNSVYIQIGIVCIYIGNQYSLVYSDILEEHIDKCIDDLVRERDIYTNGGIYKTKTNLYTCTVYIGEDEHTFLAHGQRYFNNIYIGAIINHHKIYNPIYIEEDTSSTYIEEEPITIREAEVSRSVEEIVMGPPHMTTHYSEHADFLSGGRAWNDLVRQYLGNNAEETMDAILQRVNNNTVRTLDEDAESDS